MDDRSRQLRRDIIELSRANGGYHFGGTFSCVEILRVLFESCLLSENDRFILSKGHACWGYYVLLREKGLLPRLDGHPHRDVHNGVHWTTGSEGHGLPAAFGMALAKKLKEESGTVYVLVGDGECQEGTTWETILLAGHHRLSNLVVIVDNNGAQGSGFVADIAPVSSVIVPTARAAYWEVHRVDGHNLQDLRRAIACVSPFPLLVLADTVKGKGVGFMEGKPEWHAKWLDDAHLQQALIELQ